MLPAPIPSNLDVLLAGPPCQGFSTAGKRALDDPRNALLLLAGRIAVSHSPKVILIENVRGVTAGAHGRYWEELGEILKAAGYRISEILCDAYKMGVAQIRRRQVMFAWNTGKDFDLSWPEQIGGTLRSVLLDVAKAPNHTLSKSPANARLVRIARHIRPGQKLSNVRSGLRVVHTWEIPDVFGKTTSKERQLLASLMRIRRRRRLRDFGDADPVPACVLARDLKGPVADVLADLCRKGYVRKSELGYDLVRSFNDKYRRLEWDKPSYTVDTRFGNPHYFLHPSENRGFTVREAARIQGFPDSFVFRGSMAAQYRMVGNAVPPPIARILANLAKRALT